MRRRSCAARWLKFMERNAPKKEPVFVGVPGSQTFARFVKLPPVEPKKIPEIVKFEAIQQIPFPLDQVNWDYQTFQSPESPDVEVGIFAMKKELVAQVLSHFQECKIAVAGVQMSPLAVFNAVEFDELTDGKGTVVLDIGAKDTNLIFVDHKRLWLRTINIGGNNFTDALAKSFRLSFHKAEDLKKTAATSKYARQVYQSMRPVFADLVAEIQRSIGFYNSSHRDSRLERVIGMGNPFKLPNLQKYLAQNLSMEVIRLENFKNAAAEKKLMAGLNENILGLPSAYGLALQGLDQVEIDTNLLPMEIARQMLWKEKRPWFIAAAALVAVGLGVAGIKTTAIDAPAFATSRRSRPGVYAAERQEDARNSSEPRRIIAQFPHTYKDDKDQVLSFVNLSSDRAIWPRIMYDILDALPQNNPANFKTLKGPRHERRVIMIRSITSDYTTTPDTSGSTPGSAPAARGFTVTITGYTPLSVPDRKAARDLIREYLQAIKDRAPEATVSVPIYYNFRSAPPAYQTSPIGSAATGATAGSGDVIWGGSNMGPFASEFAPGILGLVPATQPATGAPGAEVPVPGGIRYLPPPGGAAPPGGLGDAGVPAGITLDKINIPIEPSMDGHPGESMIGDDSFTATFTVYIAPVAPSK